ncbi:MAG TPA: hypothetical protein VF622_13845 [Segetibacter sp.]|jgi:hypothetical protein
MEHIKAALSFSKRMVEARLKPVERLKPNYKDFELKAKEVGQIMSIKKTIKNIKTYGKEN